MFSEGAKRRKRDPQVWSARGSLTIPLAVFSLAPDLSFEYGPVARVRKKYGCFAVYSYYNKWSFVKLSRNNA